MSVSQQPPEVWDRDGRRVFSPAQADCLDTLTQQAFAFCDPYETALAETGCPMVRVGLDGEGGLAHDSQRRPPAGQQVIVQDEAADPFVTIIDWESRRMK